MEFLKFAKDKIAFSRMQDEAYHAAAVQEIDSGKRRDGLWAKAVIESSGNEVKAKIAYLRLLVVGIRDEHYLSGRLVEEQAIRARADVLAVDKAEAQRKAQIAVGEAAVRVARAAELRGNQWRYHSNGKQYGPVSGIELRYHIKSESVRPDDKVIGPGMTEWIRAIDALSMLEEY